MFRVEMLPAHQGDALWVEYGDSEQPHRIVIDGGTPPTNKVLEQRILALPPEQRRLELLLISHIDSDHIGGLLKVLADPVLNVAVDQVWFNGYQHLPDSPADTLGPVEGEIISTWIDRRGLPWNRSFSAGAVVVPAEGPLPVHELPGGMRLTLLSPGPDQLRQLRREWSATIRAAGINTVGPRTPADTAVIGALAARRGVPLDLLGPSEVDVRQLAATAFQPDRSSPNGSSIVVLAEYNGAAVLFGADGFPGVIESNVRRLLRERGRERLQIDAFKVPHHGSRHNVNITLLEALSCRRYLFSTNGAIFGHPDEEAVARIIASGDRDSTLHFNYRSAQNSMWSDDSLQRKAGFQTCFPEPGQTGLALEL
jgi:beta-lactamase superfamily II metal-dependent hydrolase